MKATVKNLASKDKSSGVPPSGTCTDEEVDMLLAMINDVDSEAATEKNPAVPKSEHMTETPDEISAGATTSGPEKKTSTELNETSLDPIIFDGYPPSWDHKMLRAELSRVTSIYRGKSDYTGIRNDYLRVSFALNNEGLIAPAYRDQPFIPYLNSKRAKIHATLLTDQIVIDCHWLHCSGSCIQTKFPEFDALFDKAGCEFDTELAVKLASRKWSREFRADDVLFLTDYQQYQLLQLCSREKRDHYKRLTGGTTDKDNKTRIPAEWIPIRRAINSWAERKSQVNGQQEAYANLWLARELLGDKAPISQIAHLSAMMCGVKPLADKTIRDKIIRLDRILGRVVEV